MQGMNLRKKKKLEAQVSFIYKPLRNFNSLDSI